MHENGVWLEDIKKFERIFKDALVRSSFLFSSRRQTDNSCIIHQPLLENCYFFLVNIGTFFFLVKVDFRHSFFFFGIDGANLNS
jgi:hypothetical protein